MNNIREEFTDPFYIYPETDVIQENTNSKFKNHAKKS